MTRPPMQNILIQEAARPLALATREMTTSKLVRTMAEAFDRAATSHNTTHHAALAILRDLEDAGFLILHTAEHDFMRALLTYRTREMP